MRNYKLEMYFWLFCAVLWIPFSGLILYSYWSYFSTKIAYDCRLATYPTAVDVPQEVIKKCREKK